MRWSEQNELKTKRDRHLPFYQKKDTPTFFYFPPSSKHSSGWCKIKSFDSIDIDWCILSIFSRREARVESIRPQRHLWMKWFWIPPDAFGPFQELELASLCMLWLYFCPTALNPSPFAPSNAIRRIKNMQADVVVSITSILEYLRYRLMSHTSCSALF
jgi:hypothetical protein